MIYVTQILKDEVNFWFQHEYEKQVAAKTATSVDEAFTDLHEVLIKVQNKFVPLKQVKIQAKRNKKEWVDNIVKRECLKKQKLFEEYLRVKTDWARKRYKLQRNKTKDIIRQTKANYFEKALSSKEDQGHKNFYRLMKTFNGSKN